jgi:hypothetical protein
VVWAGFGYRPNNSFGRPDASATVGPEDYLWGEALAVAEAAGQRWQAALVILAEGGCILWRLIGLTLRAHIGKGQWRIGPRLFVRLLSALEPDSMTPSRAEAELRRAQAELEDLKTVSPDFARLISGRPESYELLHDYGMGSVLLATSSEEGFEYRWKRRV